MGDISILIVPGRNRNTSIVVIKTYISFGVVPGAGRDTQWAVGRARRIGCGVRAGRVCRRFTGDSEAHRVFFPSSRSHTVEKKAPLVAEGGLKEVRWARHHPPYVIVEEGES